MADNSEPVIEPAEIAEDIAPVPPAPDKPARARASVVPMLIGGVVAAAIGFFAAQALQSGLKAQLAEQALQIQTLTTQVATLVATPPQPDQAMADRLSRVEQAVAAIPAPSGVEQLAARLDAMDLRIASLPAMTASGSVDPAALAEIRAQIDGIKSGDVATAAIDAKLAEAQSSIAAIKTDAEAIAKAASQRAALHQVQAAMETGAPYATALADLTDVDLPAALTVQAQSGVPSLNALRQSFPEAARAALDAALQANSGESWGERVGAFLRSQTGARSLTPKEGNDPDAVLSRAEANLSAGDLPAALTELDNLPAEAKAAMASWLDSSKLRMDALGAVQALSNSLGQ